MSVKELKSVDISSYTIISTGIATLTSILIAIILVGVITAMVPDSFSVMVYIVPTVIFGTMLSSILIYFMEGYLYNVLAKRLRCIELDIDENGHINKISTKETALILGAIIFIILLVVYLALSLILPLILSSFITTLMYASQTGLAYMIYQYIFLISNPVNIAVGIIGAAIISSVFILLGTYIYNLLAGSERAIIVELSKEDKYTILDSINPLSYAIAFGAIGLILNFIVGIILIISGSPIFNMLTSVLVSFFVALIVSYIYAAFYNFLAPRLGKLKVELD